MTWECVGMTWECAGMMWECAGMMWECAGMMWECAGMMWECAGMTGEVVGMTWVCVRCVFVGGAALWDGLRLAGEIPLRLRHSREGGNLASRGSNGLADATGFPARARTRAGNPVGGRGSPMSFEQAHLLADLREIIGPLADGGEYQARGDRYSEGRPKADDELAGPPNVDDPT